MYGPLGNGLGNRWYPSTYKKWELLHVWRPDYAKLLPQIFRVESWEQHKIAHQQDFYSVFFGYFDEYNQKYHNFDCLADSNQAFFWKCYYLVPQINHFVALCINLVTSILQQRVPREEVFKLSITYQSLCLFFLSFENLYSIWNL